MERGREKEAEVERYRCGCSGGGTAAVCGLIAGANPL